MARIRLLLSAALAAAGVLALMIGISPGATADPVLVMKFDRMAPVQGPFVGRTNPIDGVPGGGLPWMITSANGLLQADGHVLVHVRGLVLADEAPVPAALQGTNPIPDFRAVVACHTITAGSATIVRMQTRPFPASTSGDADINDFVTLPHPCIAPVVFVTSPTGSWFAATGS